jgi:hypothetical protein
MLRVCVQIPQIGGRRGEARVREEGADPSFLPSGFTPAALPFFICTTHVRNRLLPEESTEAKPEDYVHRFSQILTD